MDWTTHPLLILLAAICVLAGWLSLRRRAPVHIDAIDAALARIRNGETGVRLEPLAWGRDARMISRFNAALAEIEAGCFDWDRATPEDSAMFKDLRKDGVSSGTLITYVAVAEIDRFTTLRQSTGYRIANLLLAQLGQRITAAIATAELGRIGRTTIEFAFKAETLGEAQMRLMSAIQSLEQRLVIDDYSFDLSVAIGFADAGKSSIRDELVDQAAAALTAAQAERVKVCFADAAILNQNSLVDLELMRAFPVALAAGQIDLHYQPKLESRTNIIKSVEALVRWHRPESGLVATDRFIALAEETGAIRELTEWVIARAVRDQKALQVQGHEIEIYVNISGQLLPDRDFAHAALDIVQDACGKIGFEITETAVIGDPDAALANLHEFTNAGIRIAIDDYGSGLSSLAYLKQLPAHELKIDRMFVSGLTDSHRDPLLVRSSIDLAHALEMEVTAEGVDDAMALSLLRIMGCDLLQGYFISPPLPLDSLVAFLNDEEQVKRLGGQGDGGQWPLFGKA
ncbi:EAL domain-containing protein [Sphingomonas sp.]|jgi:EAL domain-containing protein (putative c-di-GMP-specific phosphodiesterase class I)/GGDEF domain-containing protein|uniref:EAL domain-containing protein n=1 Tax=Sphingomonas sp. TaxID=28214 RepID=UPI002EDA8E47